MRRPHSPISANALFNHQVKKPLDAHPVEFDRKTITTYSPGEVFLFTHGNFKLDLEKGELVFDGDEKELLESYSKQFKGDKNFKRDKALILLYLNSIMNFIIFGHYKTNYQALKSKTYKAKEEKNFDAGDNKYYTYSHYRGDATRFEDDVMSFCGSLLLTTLIGEVTDELNAKKSDIRQNFSYTSLPAKFSKLMKYDVDPSKRKNFPFARDGSINIGGKLYKAHKAFLSTDKLTRTYNLSAVDFPEIPESNYMPFMEDGGSVVVDEQKKIIYILDTERENECCIVDGKVEKVSSDQFYETVRNWVTGLGYKYVKVERVFDPVKVARREAPSKEEIYHLDTFFNVIGPYVIIPDEKIITEELRRDLISRYGADHVIRLTKEERENFCTNFISFGNNVLMTSPNTPKSFIDKLNDRGFNVIIPPIHLSHGSNSGVRCCSQVADDSLFEQELKSFYIKPNIEYTPYKASLKTAVAQQIAKDISKEKQPIQRD